jgi:hypothetical protein
MRLPGTIGRDLRARRHTALLLAIVALFAVRPFLGDTGAGAILFSLAILLVLLVALLTIRVDDLVGERDALLVQRRRRSFVGWALAVPAVAERLWVFFAPSPRLFLVGSVSWLLFFCYVTWSQLRTLLKQREVTSETISMSISIYLFLGLSWGLLYIVIFTHHPEAFSFGTSPELRLRVRASVDLRQARSWEFEPNTRSTRVPVHLSAPVARSRLRTRPWRPMPPSTPCPCRAGSRRTRWSALPAAW